MSTSEKAIRVAAAIAGVLTLLAAANFYLELGWFGSRSRLVLSLSLLLVIVVVAMALRHKDLGTKLR